MTSQNQAFDNDHPKLKIVSRFGRQIDFIPYSGGLTELQVSQVLYGRRKLTANQAKAWSDQLGLTLKQLEPYTKMESE